MNTKESIPESVQPLLKKLFNDNDLVAEIMEKAAYYELPEDTVIVEIDSYIKSIPIVLDGLIKVMREDEDGNEILLYYLQDLSSCAMSLSCCMNYGKSKVKAITEVPTKLIRVPIEHMDDWMTKYREWRGFVVDTSSSKFESLLDAVDTIAFKKMDERLMQYLENKSELLDSSVLNITHQEIANELSTSREVISRLLKQLENLGEIKLHRNKIEML